MATASTRARLARMYVEQVGYDPFEDDPTITPSEVAEGLRWFRNHAGWLAKGLSEAEAEFRADCMSRPA